MTTRGLLRVDELPVDDDFEDASARGDEGELGCGVFELFEDLRRQTGGSVEIASDRAIFDRDLHAHLRGSAGPAAPRRGYANRDGRLADRSLGPSAAPGEPGRRR